MFFLGCRDPEVRYVPREFWKENGGPFSMVVEMVPVKGGRDYITSQKARTISGLYKWYILLIG